VDRTDFTKLTNDEIVVKKQNLIYTYEALKSVLKELDDNLTFIENEYKRAVEEENNRGIQ
jgi:hydrogenase maturation factor